MTQNLPEWIKTTEDYTRWQQGEGPSGSSQTKRFRQPSFSLVVGLIAVVVIIFGAYAYIKGTPQYSLYQLKNAMLARDAEKAMRYLDVDSVVDNLMKESFAKEEAQPRDEWEQAGRNFGMAIVAAMLPSMKENMKSALRTGIISAQESNLDNLKKNEILDFHVVRTGYSALITSKKDPTFQFRMVKVPEGHWRIVEFILPKDRT